MVESKRIERCEQCAWAKLPAFEGFVWCRLKGLEVWGKSQACAEADDVGVF